MDNMVVIKTITDTVIGKLKRTRKPWFNNSCEEDFNRRKEFNTQSFNDPTNREKIMLYKEYQKKQIIYLDMKNGDIKDLLEETRIDHTVKRTQLLYQEVNTIIGGYKKHKKFLKIDDGSLVIEPDKVLENWNQYFRLFFNCENPVMTFEWMSTKPNDIECPPPSKEEILQQHDKLKNNKTTKEDKIQGKC